MNKTAWILTFSCFPVAAFALEATQDWAFLTPDPNAPVAAAPANNGNTSPAPTPQPAVPAGMPTIVAVGKGQDVRPCSTCHTPSGMGMPESANLRGLPVNYFVEQMQDFRSGARKGPRSGAMVAIVKGMTDDEIKEVATYYNGLKPTVWTAVSEMDTAPKSFVSRNGQRLKSPEGGTETVGLRVIEFSPNQPGVRNAQSNAFVAYVPSGSLAKGEALVTMGAGGKTTACVTCHGTNLQGVGDVPIIAGRSPIYIARQLYTFQNNDRTGPNGDVMKAVVSKLDNEEIVAISAYVASRSPS